MTRSLAALAVTAALSSLAAAPEKKPLTLGITATYGAEAADRAKAQLEPWLTAKLGSGVTVKVLPTYEALSDALADSSVDLAWITPLAFVRASQKNADVQAAVKAMRGGDGGLSYRSVFVVKRSSPIKALGDLRGRSVAWVDKLSASGYLFPRELLRREKLDPDALFSAQSFLGDHLAVCRAVREGKADVGATFANGQQGRSELVLAGCAGAPPVEDFRVVASTANLPNEVIAVSPRFPMARLNDVMASFGRMGQDGAGKKLLKDVFRVDGWGAAVAGDFDPVIELLQAKGTRAKVAPEAPAETAPAPAAAPAREKQ